MPDTLFGEGARLLQSSAREQTGETRAAVMERGQEARGNQLATVAGAKIAAKSQEEQTKIQASQQLEMLKAQLRADGKLMTIPPQVAIGLAKDLHDPGWLNFSGTEMDPRQFSAMVSSKLKSRWTPKITQSYGKDGTVRHSLVTLDDDGNPVEYFLDSGMNADKLHPKGKSGSGRGGGDDQLAKDKVWLKEYDGDKKWLSSKEGLRTKTLDPDKYNVIQARVEDMSPKADDIMRRLESPEDGTPSGTPEASGGTPVGAGITDNDWSAIFSGAK